MHNGLGETAGNGCGSEQRFENARDAASKASCDNLKGYPEPTTATSPTGPRPFNSKAVTLDNIDDAMEYHPWERDQQLVGNFVRGALSTAAKAILLLVPDGPYRSTAIRKLLEVRMDCNAAITFRGRF